MPNFFTHYLCGHKALNLMEDSEIKTTVSKFINVFNLGTQGPDILFYHHIWPWRKKAGVADIGEHMHQNSVSAMFAFMLEYLTDIKDIDSEVLKAYIFGFICHYALDCTAHPFVFYMTGFVRPLEAPTEKYTYYHRSFETAIDTLMLQHESMPEPNAMKPHSLISLRGDEEKIIAQMYGRMLRKVYGIELDPKEVVTAIRDMVRIFQVLRDKSGIKKRILSSIEKRIAEPGAFTSTIYDNRIRRALDYLNLNKSVWKLPWDNSIESTQSFLELFDKSVVDTVELWKSVDSYLNGNVPLTAAMQRIGNRSFSTGLDCDLNLEFKFFDCIYEK